MSENKTREVIALIIGGVLAAIVLLIMTGVWDFDNKKSEKEIEMHNVNEISYKVGKIHQEIKKFNQQFLELNGVILQKDSSIKAYEGQLIDIGNKIDDAQKKGGTIDSLVELYKEVKLKLNKDIAIKTSKIAQARLYVINLTNRKKDLLQKINDENDKSSKLDIERDSLRKKCNFE